MDLRNETAFYLNANAVRTSPLRLTIRMSRRADADDTRSRPVVCFREDAWALRLNKVNLRTLTAAFGWETNHWLGKVVEAHFDSAAEFGGEMVGGVRLRIPAEQAYAGNEVTKQERAA